MWERIKENALSTIITIIITGVLTMMGSSLVSKNKTLDEVGEIKNQIEKNFDSLNSRLDTELKLIDLKNKMQDEKITDLEEIKRDYAIPTAFQPFLKELENN